MAARKFSALPRHLMEALTRDGISCKALGLGASSLLQTSPLHLGELTGRGAEAILASVSWIAQYDES